MLWPSPALGYETESANMPEYRILYARYQIFPKVTKRLHELLEPESAPIYGC